MAGRGYKTEAVVLRSFRLGEADRVLHLYTLALSVQLKLLWLSGYLPHLTSCANCGSNDAPLIGYSAAAGGAVCAACRGDALALSPTGIAAIESMLARPLAEAGAVGVTDRAARDALAVITSAYEYFGNFRLRTLRSA